MRFRSNVTSLLLLAVCLSLVTSGCIDRGAPSDGGDRGYVVLENNANEQVQVNLSISSINSSNDSEPIFEESNTIKMGERIRTGQVPPGEYRVSVERDGQEKSWDGWLTKNSGLGIAIGDEQIQFIEIS